MQTLVSHVNAHQKVRKAHEFNNQIDRIARSVERQPLPLAILWTHGCRDGGHPQGLNNMDYHSPKLAKLRLLPSAKCAGSRDHTEPLSVAAFPRVTSQNQRRTGYADPCWKRQHITRNQTAIWAVDLPLLHVIFWESYLLFTIMIVQPRTHRRL